MGLEFLRNKKIAVLGLSVEGTSTAKFLQRNGIPFTVLEKKERSELPPATLQLLDDGKNEFQLGSHHLNGLGDFDVIFRSQGIPLWQPSLSQVRQKGRVVSSMTKLFFDLCPCPIIGVTGTKGKGTTATLIYEMLKGSGFAVHLGGNIGLPPLDFLEKLNPESWVVLELSSFQLEDLHQSPHLGVVLMVTAEHLNSQAPESPNFHRSLAEYLTAKKNLVRFQKPDDFAVINFDFESSRSFAQETAAKVLPFSLAEKFAEGGYLSGDDLLICLSQTCQKICRRSEVFLRGEHNLQNVLAASLAAMVVGGKLSSVQKVVKTFKGLAHRLEFVATVKGVKFYNDSFSTTPETGIAAIKSFSEPEIIILGGSEKGSDYRDLGQAVVSTQNVKAVILIGNTASQIKESIVAARGLGPKMRVVPILVEGLSSLEKVVRKAYDLASPGDVVLLSPACASFDMFKNYKERGEIFKKFVNDLKV